MNKLIIIAAFSCLIAGCTFTPAVESSTYVPSGAASVAVR